MTPEQLLQNATNLGKLIVPGLAGFAAVVGTAAWMAGKTGNNPGLQSMGKNGWLAGIVGAAATAVYALITNIGTRLSGGG